MKDNVRTLDALAHRHPRLPLVFSRTAAARLGRCTNTRLLMRLHRPIGIWLLMWPMLWALWIAGDGHPDERLLIIFLLGAVLMRSAGCVINDYADRDIDPFVKRTSDRPLAARRVTSSGSVAAVRRASGLVAVGLVFMLNPLAQLLAVAGAAARGDAIPS